ncbi:hypothetical protein EDB19DRAFT_1683464 [Suillus lakei]|nr:hypothetical protein EDB19DRAFT_1683464 [Suillus lakei]
MYVDPFPIINVCVGDSKYCISTINTQKAYLMATANYTCEATLSVPRGWNEDIFASDKVKQMLVGYVGKTSDSTKDMLLRDRSDYFVFSSGDDFYCVSLATSMASVVTSTKGKEQLWYQMDEDMTQVQWKLIPDTGRNLY